MPVPDPSPLKDKYSAGVLALWGEKDEESTKKWWDEKLADFTAGGKMKEKYETEEKLIEWMTDKVYGPSGTMDKTLAIRGNPKVFFDMTADGETIGRIVMQLRMDVVPKTAENFKQLCLKEEGEGYQKCLFHRVIPVRPMPLLKALRDKLFLACIRARASARERERESREPVASLIV